ncbi:MAG: 1-acyl-sn-glycerol-3-phosphate acyltransferase [Sphingobacteriaceae bacterium]|nr:1-acyl-sn-glycerol-3-phosphate acyltransferase [Sphingobacteriaceae bacterium]
MFLQEKKEIEKWPLFHIYYTSGMNVLVDRNSKTGSIGALKKMSHEIDKGNPLAIFPEGTISRKAPALAPFKSGAFALAIQKQIPIVPVIFVTNWKRLQRGGFWKGKAGPGIAEVVISKPVITTGLGKDQIDQPKAKSYYKWSFIRQIKGFNSVQRPAKDKYHEFQRGGAAVRKEKFGTASNKASQESKNPILLGV